MRWYPRGLHSGSLNEQGAEDLHNDAPQAAPLLGESSAGVCERVVTGVGESDVTNTEVVQLAQDCDRVAQLVTPVYHSVVVSKVVRRW